MPTPLTQAAGAQAVVGPRLRLGLVAVEDLLHQLLHGEARAAVAVAAGPLDAVNWGRQGRGQRPPQSSAPPLPAGRLAPGTQEEAGESPGCPASPPSTPGGSLLFPCSPSLLPLGCSRQWAT